MIAIIYSFAVNDFQPKLRAFSISWIIYYGIEDPWRQH
jgi:hypothetical protein